MRAGLLRQTVTIQQASVTTDTQGGRVQTWTPLACVAASVLPIGGGEGIAADALTSTLSTTVTIRYRVDVTVQQRILWGTRTLQIARVQDPTGRREQLDLLCTEVQA